MDAAGGSAGSPVLGCIWRFGCLLGGGGREDGGEREIPVCLIGLPPPSGLLGIRRVACTSGNGSGSTCIMAASTAFAARKA